MGKIKCPNEKAYKLQLDYAKKYFKNSNVLGVEALDDSAYVVYTLLIYKHGLRTEDVTSQYPRQYKSILSHIMMYGNNKKKYPIVDYIIADKESFIGLLNELQLTTVKDF